MRITKTCFFINLLFLGLLLFPAGFYAQKNEQIIDKKLEEAKLNIYQNPEIAIKLASEIYQETQDTGNKITALITLVNGYTAINQNENALIFAVKGNGYKDEIDCAYAIENYDLAIAAYQKTSWPF